MSASALSPEWRAWIAENLAAGHEAEPLLERLVAAGVDEQIGRNALHDVATNTDLEMVAHFAERTRRRQAIIDLQREVRRHDEIDTIVDLDPADFMRHHFHGNRPAFLPGFASSWPATSRWSLPWFAEQFGDVSIEVCRGRDRDPTPDRNYEQHVETMTIRDFVSAIEHAGATNDLYAISNNKVIANPALQCLFDDITPDPALFPLEHRQPGAVALWLGPGGTRTPLHHDTANVMLTQIQGRKRITLISPLETKLADTARDFYAETDVGTELWDQSYHDVQTHTVEVGPGDAVLIPAGWWHRVEALAPSISFVLLGFSEPNDFGWYRPGSLRPAPSSEPVVTAGNAQLS